MEKIYALYPSKERNRGFSLPPTPTSSCVSIMTPSRRENHQLSIIRSFLQTLNLTAAIFFISVPSDHRRPVTTICCRLVQGVTVGQPACLTFYPLLLPFHCLVKLSAVNFYFSVFIHFKKQCWGNIYNCVLFSPILCKEIIIGDIFYS